MKVAFLDRDGTIVKDYPDDHWPQVRELEFLPNAFTGMRKLLAARYQICIVSNQYRIDKGYITRERYLQTSDHMCACLKSEGIEILDIFYCPHARNTICSCWKPAPGMVEAAMKKYPSIYKAVSFIVGDSDCAQRLAESCGLPFYRVHEGFDLVDMAESVSGSV